MRLLPAQKINPGDRTPIAREERVGELRFKVHKFTPRPRPEAVGNVAIFPHFCEFGSEFVASMYCLPFLMNGRYQGKYSVVMGWHGRAYLYRHLVDEFWELDEGHMHLREHTRCFHHESVNLKRAEKAVARYGTVVNTPYEYGVMAVQKKLAKCQKAGCGGSVGVLSNGNQRCVKCRTYYAPPGFYNYIADVKERAVWVPSPSDEKRRVAERFLKPNSVGVTARNRKCYGRNLPADFYKRLLEQLIDSGYDPVWLGERSTTLECPLPGVTDFSRTPEANDLETTLALVSGMKFTLQFWTASTRLAGVMGTPYLLFESPDQIYGNGQEGIRMSLCSRGPKKLVLAHYKSVVEDQDTALAHVSQAVAEMEAGDYRDIIGLVESEQAIEQLRQGNVLRIGAS